MGEVRGIVQTRGNECQIRTVVVGIERREIDVKKNTYIEGEIDRLW